MKINGKVVLICFLIVFLFRSFVFSQNLQWQNYTNGNEINEITVDNDTLWIATMEEIVWVKEDGIEYLSKPQTEIYLVK